MNMINTWQFWVIIYLFAAVMFAQNFKKANRKMKNAGSLTVLLELFTGLFSLLMIPIFDIKFALTKEILLVLLIVICIYAITDRLNIEVRYGLETSTFSMLKRLSTVFMIIFGFVFLKEEVVFNIVLGALIIIIANVILAYNKGKFQVNKYFVMAIVANFFFAVAMLLNVGISDHFNLAFYTWMTVTGPAIIISVLGKHSIKDLKKEFKLYDKPRFFVSAFAWALMLNASIRAYQLGSVIVVASLFCLTPILNSLAELIFHGNKDRFVQKVIISILLIIGVVLVNL